LKYQSNFCQWGSGDRDSGRVDSKKSVSKDQSLGNGQDGAGLTDMCFGGSAALSAIAGLTLDSALSGLGMDFAAGSAAAAGLGLAAVEDGITCRKFVFFNFDIIMHLPLFV
jgi:hypothetical protein